MVRLSQEELYRTHAGQKQKLCAPRDGCCGEYKNVELFYKSAGRYKVHCKECMKRLQREKGTAERQARGAVGRGVHRKKMASIAYRWILSNRL